METRPRIKVTSDRLVKPGIKPATPGLQGKWFIHYTTVAPRADIGSSERAVMGLASPAVSARITKHFVTIFSKTCNNLTKPIKGH